MHYFIIRTTAQRHSKQSTPLHSDKEVAEINDAYLQALIKDNKSFFLQYSEEG